MKSDLEKLVAKSEAANSLRLEARLASSIKRGKWSTIHSWYYEDVVSHKTREIDVVSQYLRRYRKLGRWNTIAIECKSLRGSHILFSSPIWRPTYFKQLPYWWIGTDDLLRQRFVAELVNRGAQPIQVESFLKKVQELAYPAHMWRTYPVTIFDPPADQRYSAFRETTIGATKDLESSVVWKAVCQLQSAIQSAITRERNRAFENILIPLEGRATIDAELVSDFLWGYAEHTPLLYIWHPIIVLEACLWEVALTKTRPIRQCRLSLEGHGGPCQWIDVVSVESAAEFIGKLQRYYEKRSPSPFS